MTPFFCLISGAVHCAFRQSFEFLKKFAKILSKNRIFNVYIYRRNFTTEGGAPPGARKQRRTAMKRDTRMLLGTYCTLLAVALALTGWLLSATDCAVLVLLMMLPGLAAVSAGVIYALYQISRGR